MRPRLRAVLLALLALSLAPGAWGLLDGLRALPRGVNDAGGEFWDGRRAGLPIRFSSPATQDWIAGKGFGVVRLPFRWEEVQPSLFGEFAPKPVESLRAYVRAARERGLGVILDPHNGARYEYPGPDGALQTGIVGTPPVTYEAFADFWRRMSREFRGEPGVWAYCLMNEPNNIVTRHWEEASQAAVDAIRAEGDPTRILVPGSNYSSVHIWVHCHGRDAWITDPMQNFAYEAHCYFDSKGSGHYALPYEEEARLDPDLEERTTKRLQIFVDWCEANGVEGFIGEFGCPDDPQWLAHMDRFLDLMDRSRMGGTAWAAGEAWPKDYKMLLTASSGQVGVLASHQGRWLPGSDFCRGYRLLFRRCWNVARLMRDAFHRWRTGKA